jgi:hypothetical protein
MAENEFANVAEWLDATKALAKTLRDFVSLQAKQQQELRIFSEKAKKELGKAQPSSSSNGSGLFLTRVSALFEQVATAQGQLCHSLPIDIDELEAELNTHVERLQVLQDEARNRRQTYDRTKKIYIASLNRFRNSFTEASKSLGQARVKGINSNVFACLDMDSNAQVKGRKELEIVADKIRNAKHDKEECTKRYSEFRKTAMGFLGSVESVYTNRQVIIDAKIFDPT